MNEILRVAMLLLTAVPLIAQAGPVAPQSFEVASIKPSAPDDRSGRFITMQGAHQFVAKNHTLKTLVMAAYNAPAPGVIGGPAWFDIDRFDIVAAAPGESRPPLDVQMAMLRTLLGERFKLAFHREQRDAPVYELTVARGGPTLKETATPSEVQPVLVNRLFPGRVQLPARNATMSQFASMLQRSVLDRHVLDKTGLSGRYDFDLEWTPDETQFGGQLPPVPTTDTSKPDLFAALQQQLGLRLQASKGLVDVIVVDRVERP
jgi:uncharacterized protein (TIGR03435 family)